MLKAADAAGGSAATAAAIAIKPWAPDTPYLKAIKSAAPARAYAAYLEQRKAYAESPAFYLDCAGALLPIDKALGLRVLSNLAEMKLDDAALLRAFAWRLGEAAELDRAVEDSRARPWPASGGSAVASRPGTRAGRQDGPGPAHGRRRPRSHGC